MLLGFGGGAFAGILIVLVLDRMASYGEFQCHFAENVVGQIPKEAAKGQMPLLHGFAKTQGIALGITIALAAIVSGILYLAADHPPTLDGKSLALEFELKIPLTLKLPTQPGAEDLHASLYANDRDNHYAVLDYDKIATRDGYIFVPGKASLLSQTFNRDLLVSIESEGASQFIKLKLGAKPTKEDEAWSDWMMATQRADLTPVPEADRIAVRYRVQPEK